MRFATVKRPQESSRAGKFVNFFKSTAEDVHFAEGIEVIPSFDDKELDSETQLLPSPSNFNGKSSLTQALRSLSELNPKLARDMLAAIDEGQPKDLKIKSQSISGLRSNHNPEDKKDNSSSILQELKGASEDIRTSLTYSSRQASSIIARRQADSSVSSAYKEVRPENSIDLPSIHGVFVDDNQQQEKSVTSSRASLAPRVDFVKMPPAEVIPISSILDDGKKRISQIVQALQFARKSARIFEAHEDPLGGFEVNASQVKLAFKHAVPMTSQTRDEQEETITENIDEKAERDNPVEMLVEENFVEKQNIDNIVENQVENQARVDSVENQVENHARVHSIENQVGDDFIENHVKDWVTSLEEEKVPVQVISFETGTQFLHDAVVKPVSMTVDEITEDLEKMYEIKKHAEDSDVEELLGGMASSHQEGIDVKLKLKTHNETDSEKDDDTMMIGQAFVDELLLQNPKKVGKMNKFLEKMRKAIKTSRSRHARTSKETNADKISLATDGRTTSSTPLTFSSSVLMRALDTSRVQADDYLVPSSPKSPAADRATQINDPWLLEVAKIRARRKTYNMDEDEDEGGNDINFTETDDISLNCKATKYLTVSCHAKPVTCLPQRVKSAKTVPSLPKKNFGCLSPFKGADALGGVFNENGNSDDSDSVVRDSPSVRSNAESLNSPSSYEVDSVRPTCGFCIVSSVENEANEFNEDMRQLKVDFENFSGCEGRGNTENMVLDDLSVEEHITGLSVGSSRVMRSVAGNSTFDSSLCSNSAASSMSVPHQMSSDLESAESACSKKVVHMERSARSEVSIGSDVIQPDSGGMSICTDQSKNVCKSLNKDTSKIKNVEIEAIIVAGYGQSDVSSKCNKSHEPEVIAKSCNTDQSKNSDRSKLAASVGVKTTTKSTTNMKSRQGNTIRQKRPKKGPETDSDTGSSEDSFAELLNTISSALIYDTKKSEADSAGSVSTKSIMKSLPPKNQKQSKNWFW